jgi:hypothetical protein
LPNSFCSSHGPACVDRKPLLLALPLPTDGCGAQSDDSLSSFRLLRSDTPRASESAAAIALGGCQFVAYNSSQVVDMASGQSQARHTTAACCVHWSKRHYHRRFSSRDFFRVLPKSSIAISNSAQHYKFEARPSSDVGGLTLVTMLKAK